MIPNPTRERALLLALLQQLPSKGSWSKATEQMYLIGLMSIPDEAVGMICRAVLETCNYRPTVSEIIGIWRRLNSPGPLRTPDALSAEVFSLIHKGPNQAPHPTIPRVFVPGPPPNAPADALVVIAAMGGWGSVMSDDSPSGVIRGQILKVAERVLGRDGDEAIDKLRSLYQEERAGRMLDGQPVNQMPAGISLGDREEGGLSQLGSIAISSRLVRHDGISGA